MRVDELHSLFKDFKENEFHDLNKKVDRLVWVTAVGYGIITAVLVLVKFFI